jgi:H+/Cl- antiporter ClcA
LLVATAAASGAAGAAVAPIAGAAMTASASMAKIALSHRWRNEERPLRFVVVPIEWSSI